MKTNYLFNMALGVAGSWQPFVGGSGQPCVGGSGRPCVGGSGQPCVGGSGQPCVDGSGNHFIALIQLKTSNVNSAHPVVKQHQYLLLPSQ